MDLDRAAALIREGRLVAFPTETVYGLGANALDERAVAAIFRAKGRPSTSPVIVHVDSPAMARGLVAEWPAAAEALTARFWPGPLTLVLPKLPAIPDIVTAGLGTVGLRMPAHPVALALIRAAGVPIAAPSANRFTGISPTRAEHVRQSLGDAVDLVLDGGPTDVGLESTVLSLAGEPELLRPGMVSHEAIEAVIGPVRAAHGVEQGAHRAPGMHPRHYSPRTPVVVVSPGAALPPGAGAWLWISQPRPGAKSVRMAADARGYASALYSILHSLDAESLDWIAVERPPEGGEWEAVHDRLRRMTA